MPLVNLLQDPPTYSSRNEAKSRLELHKQSLDSLIHSIQSAEEELAQIVSKGKSAIDQLMEKKRLVENEISLTLAYISPIRTLPQELLRHIFMLNFEQNPCCAWGLARVSVAWRKLVLSIPTLWSKIRLVTTLNSTADTIRLWLERSGNTIPLDIEIVLRVQNSSGNGSRYHSSSPLRHLLLPPIGQFVNIPSTMPLLPGQHPFMLPSSPLPPPLHLSSPPALVSPAYSGTSSLKTSIHWGHIAFFYLADQMHRWERFVFRFDKQFPSISALKSVVGDAPLLREFEVSCAEPAFYPDWSWLPCAKADAAVSLPQLSSLTLRYMPFTWSSSVFKGNLQSLTLRSLPTSHLTLDRVLHIIAANPKLRYLDLHIGAVHPAILPLTPLTLGELTELNLGGHYLLSQLVDNLSLPVITSLTYDVETRDSLEETITNLMTRSNNPPLSQLSLAYGLSTLFHFGAAAGGVISWNFLLELTELTCLKVGGTQFEPPLVALTTPDEDQHRWYCPKLRKLYMRGCHAHGNGVAKLVHMINARTNASGAPSSQTPVEKLSHLELHECTTVGSDVLQWLKNRIPDVICTEPPYERLHRSPGYAYP